MVTEDTKDKLKSLDSKTRLEAVYNSSIRKKTLFMSICGVVLVFITLIYVAVGAVDIPLDQALKAIGNAIFPNYVDPPSKPYYLSFMKERFYRAVLCIVTGISLAIAGTIMQGLLRNPLVSPFTLGVSSAASFGAAMAIVFWPIMFGTFSGSIHLIGGNLYYSDLFTVLLALLFGTLSMGIVILMTSRANIGRSTVILAGVIISYLFQAGVSLAKYMSNEEALREITNWLLGGMWNASVSVDLLIIPIVAICLIYLESLAPRINVLGAGDEVAESLGINVKKLRNNGLLVSTFMTSVCLAFTGIIGFVGLMAPHLTRMIIGNETKYLIPASGLVGAIIILVSDLVGRMIIRPSELPVGIFMYIFGGIFFIWMMMSKKKEVKM